MKTETKVGLFILSAVAVFIYLSLNIREFRFDKHQYYTYKAYFDDTGGLMVKSPVKIAGVDVGWVEAIDLLDNGKAEIVLRVNKVNKLAKNAYAMIHQDGLIGTKTVEIDPGDPTLGILLPGSVLSMPGKTPASVGELLDQFRDIATTIQDITASFKEVFASRKGEDHMRIALQSVARATERLADFTEVLHRNESNFTHMITDFRATAAELKKSVPTISGDVHNVAESFKTNADKLTTDLGGASKKVSGAFEQIEDGAIQAKDAFKEASQVLEKVNTGKGTVGKLINEEETYTDLKKSIKGFRDYIGKTQALMLNIDMHTETMLRNKNSKGYFDLRLRPNSDCFYQVQLVAAEKGGISRDVRYITRKDAQGNVLNTDTLTLAKKVEFAQRLERVTQKKNDILFGLQFGKRFDRLVFRVGLFENSFGAAVDYYVPLQTDKLHWITTLEAFDLSGTSRLNDTRPHIKWLNKAFFLRNFYTAFGVDDLCSKHDANPFIGGGLRFGDDDLKYFLSYLSAGKSAGK